MGCFSQLRRNTCEISFLGEGHAGGVENSIMFRRFVFLLLVITSLLILPGCETTANKSALRKAMNDAIAAEPKGAYYVGRRYFKKDYRFWGFVRRSGEPWSSAKMVLMNESKKLVPDRERAAIGKDNNFEYKLSGDFTGDTIYEPASNAFYPEFMLTGYELLTETPGPIYREAGATDPKRRIIPKPY